MKYSRLLFGLLVVVIALWVLVGEQMAGASANAFVNARVVTVRSDVAGQVDMPARSLGARVAQGEVLASVTDPLVDTIRLNDLLMERSFLEAEQARLAERHDTAKATAARLEDRSAAYAAARIADISARLDHARIRLAFLMGQVPAGTVAASEGGAAAMARATPNLAVDQARELVEVLEIALRAARAGVFLGDGYNDAPHSEQRALDLDDDIATLEAARTEAAARHAALETRIAHERRHVNGLTGGELYANADSLFWEVLAADGIFVQRGDPILRLVDCTSQMVSVSVSETVYNDLRPGQEAEFRAMGASRVFPATVSRLAGNGAATVYQTLAVAPSQDHLERYDVTLLVPGLAEDPDLNCAIGRTGRAFFDRRPLDWVRAWWP
ncbi:HlyD family efflux transporter periplasmic adaptor subunit [Sulfitobacter sabulilitoris]|uniref:HlyD family efflux transporter periplasmic adaptor subunit n=1 Tax=Sulfitobacter sabulilitoris TaxID=2562655 RepID=A0A5S3PID1_9RHOB|nr:HlyD family efflux transporter periplasmic adaptor subunit [Sulfitobacter sabulilitoris]TMM54031.1 HlyD family efflux transporter periplasmic adaptor subunit [Sulfitobacter sabulilitoris]